MSNLKFDINVEEIANKFDVLKEGFQTDLQKSAENLASMTHAKVHELARDNLSSLSKKYTDAVSFSNPAPNLWVVSLDMDKAGFIESGRKSGFMQELLDSKSAKQGKNGKYAIIPFQHNVNPSEQSEKAQALASEIKEVLKKEGINWKKIERNEDGSPRLGKLHTIKNTSSARLSPKHKGSASEGIAVYQTRDKAGNVSRDVMTFRVISEKHRNEGLWVHPGRAGDNLMDQALKWAIETFDREILPAVLEKYK